MSVNSKANDVMRKFPETFAFEMDNQIIVQTQDSDLQFDKYEDFENIVKSIITNGSTGPN